jgi:multiple sugar transport system permease protein
LRPRAWSARLPGSPKAWPYIALAPAIIVLLVGFAYPAAFGIIASFRSMVLTRPAEFGWIGFSQYVRLFSDPSFWFSLKITVLWVVSAIAIEFALGLATAALLSRQLPGSNLFAVLIVLPYFLPNVVAGHMWALMLDPRTGIINELLLRAGAIDTYQAWLAQPFSAFVCVVAAEVWHGFPFFAVILLAGMKSVPKEVLDAARLDGAGPIDRFRFVALPLMKAVIVAAIILRVIVIISAPDLIFVLTGGGPANATDVLSLRIFRTAYGDLDFGYAGSMSVVLLVVLTLLTRGYLRALERDVEGQRDV